MNSAEKKLLALFNQLGSSEQEMLLTFADFLSQRSETAGKEDDVIPEPEPIPRPESESVVAAIKRLTATYPMLDKPQLLNETSALMTKHVMQGMDVVDVVDELEALFQRFYEELVNSTSRKSQ